MKGSLFLLVLLYSLRRDTASLIEAAKTNRIKITDGVDKTPDPPDALSASSSSQLHGQFGASGSELLSGLDGSCFSSDTLNNQQYEYEFCKFTTNIVVLMCVMKYMSL